MLYRILISHLFLEWFWLKLLLWYLRLRTFGIQCNYIVHLNYLDKSLPWQANIKLFLFTYRCSATAVLITKFMSLIFAQKYKWKMYVLLFLICSAMVHWKVAIFSCRCSRCLWVFFFFLIRLLSFAWLNSRGMVLDIPFLYILCALYRYGIYSLFYTAFLIENEVVFIWNPLEFFK